MFYMVVTPPSFLLKNVLLTPVVHEYEHDVGLLRSCDEEEEGREHEEQKHDVAYTSRGSSSLTVMLILYAAGPHCYASQPQAKKTA